MRFNEGQESIILSILLVIIKIYIFRFYIGYNIIVDKAIELVSKGFKIIKFPSLAFFYPLGIVIDYVLFQPHCFALSFNSFLQFL